MPQYKYTVVNKDNQQLSGVVDTPDEASAREDLKNLGFSVISLEESKEKVKEEAGNKFEFSGIDPQKRNITGTIKSENKYQAFKRLITEYNLEVQYIVDADVKEKVKEKQKQEGIIDLMKQYKEEVEKNTDLYHKKKFKKIDRSFENKRALIMRQVDYVLKKIDNAINDFGSELSPEHVKTIKSFINKIVQLKNSSNIDYLKKTCKQALEFLQKTEIFVHRKEMLKEKVKLYKDSDEMINYIERGKDFGIYEDLQDQIERWQNEHIKGKEKVAFNDKLKNIYYNIVLKFISDSKEAREIKRKIAKLNTDLKQYYGVYFKAKDPLYKKEALKSIKKLRKRKKKLKKQLREIRIIVSEKQEQYGKLSMGEEILQNIKGVTGWLLVLYLVFYFISNIIIEKELFFETNKIPSIFFIFQSGLIKYILPIVFLLHIALGFKIAYFKKNFIASAVIFPVFLIASLLIAFNF